MAKVLVVDDEEALRLLMGRQLRRGGHDVVLAEDGLDALAAMEVERFDVVVSDMKMPRMDGMELLARAGEIAPDTEFVILTGHGNLESAIQAFKIGKVFDYLLKPLADIRQLDSVVTHAAERRQLRAANGQLVVDLQSHVEELQDTNLALEEAKRGLAELAERDGLTGLLNHRTIHEKLSEALRAAGESDPQGNPLSVILMDMDGFKLFNDTYGHAAGDQVLRSIADALGSVLGGTALPGRCGGDEFLVVLPGVTAAEAGEMANGVHAFIADRPFEAPDGAAVPLRICFGVADTPSVGSSAAALVAAADAALYASKDSGGNVITIHQRPGDDSERASYAVYDTLDSLITTIDHKDHYTKHHSDVVTIYALELVQALRLSEDTYNSVRVAGLLHDIGKIGVPDSILRKPGKLTDDEYEVMKGHVTLSALIIHGLPRLHDILDAVANHHERWDGRGYPKGLAGEAIPLLGRILAIADAFSAMTIDRPYRVGMSKGKALSEIERCAGTQFDPELARLFVQTVREGFQSRERGWAMAA